MKKKKEKDPTRKLLDDMFNYISAVKFVEYIDILVTERENEKFKDIINNTPLISRGVKNHLISKLKIKG